MIKSEWDDTFKKRLEKYYDELKWLYMELYGNNTEAFEYFLDMMYKSFVNRKEVLRKWDDKKAKHHDWYKRNDMLGMVMYVDLFNDTLDGVIEKLDYIEECKVNYLQLMPLMESPKGRSDGGYAVSDFTKVQEQFGTMEDLARLSDKCHEKGIYMCLDFVMNHTSEDHEWAVKAKQGDVEAQNRFFFFDNWNIPNEFEKTVPQVFPTTAPGNFSWCEEVGKVVMTTFHPYQWDLNYANPVVFNDMTENIFTMCNSGVDIIRLDAVPYIWKTLGTNCRNLPQVHTLVRMMNMACEVVCPGTVLLGEVVMEPSKVVPYFGTIEKPECQMLYNVTTMASTWHTVATKDTRLLKDQLYKVFQLPSQYTFLNYLRCHDDIGWGLDYDFLGQFGMKEVPHKKFLNDYFLGNFEGSPSRGALYNDDPRLGDARMCGTTASLCGLEDALEKNDDRLIKLAVNKILMLHAFLFTQSGIPVLYSGDEIAQLNWNEYVNDPEKKEDSRYIHRGKLDWDAVAKRNDADTIQGMIYQAIMKMIDIKRNHSVFSGYADMWLLNTDDNVLGVGRYYNDEKLLGYYNFTDGEKTVWLEEDETYTDLISSDKVEGREITIEPNGFRWLFHSYR